MRQVILVGLASAAIAACASNKPSDEPGTSIRDATTTAQDTTNPNDTLPHIRDSMPDSAQR